MAIINAATVDEIVSALARWRLMTNNLRVVIRVAAPAADYYAFPDGLILRLKSHTDANPIETWTLAQAKAFAIANNIDISDELPRGSKTA